MNRIKQLAGAFLMIVMVAGMLTSCEPENDIMAVASSDTLQVSNATIEQSTLVGRWELSSMTSDAAVDLNEDNTSSMDIRKETGCFEEMYFIFNEDGTVKTGQAKLDFKNNSFACSYGIYFAEYDVANENNISALEVTFQVDGLTYTDSKTIELTTTNGQQYLHVTTTASEVDGANYINDGRESTIVSQVTTLETVYKKVQ